MHPHLSRIPTLLATAIAATALASCGRYDPIRAAGVPTHYVSHQLCSAVFVGGQDPDTFYDEAIAPVVFPLSLMLSHSVDREKRTVSASFAGLLHSTAVYREALGCAIDHGSVLARADQTTETLAPSRAPPIAGPDLVVPRDPALVKALDHAFEENASAPFRRTKAIVILHDGKIIAERYAPGFGIHTPVIGWSMTKSVTNALIGILAHKGALDINAPAPVAAWSNSGDPRYAITPDNLLRMASGLDIGSSLDAGWDNIFNPSTQANYDAADEAGTIERASLSAAPGTRWTYANGNTILLSRIVRDHAGGTAQSTFRFAQRELFNTLGMEHATLEFDGAGTPIGSHSMWASARDWARFGLLYLNDGMVGGERILPVGWADYSARYTPGSDVFGYAAGFWTQRGDSTGARFRVKTGMPADSFMARGIHGQYAVIIPSARLVIVRLGMAMTWRDDIERVGALVADTIAAIAPKD